MRWAFAGLLAFVLCLTAFTVTVNSAWRNNNRPKCPKTGTLVHGVMLVRAEDFADNIYPVGRRFVLIDCWA